MIPLVFTKYPFPVLESYLGYPSNGRFCHHVSLGSSWLWPFLHFCLFLKTLTVMKMAAQEFVECPSIGICLMFFSWLDGVVGLQRKTTKVKVKTISITLYQGYLKSTWVITVDATLISWLRKYLSGFSTVKLFYPLPLSILYSLGEKNHYV